MKNINIVTESNPIKGIVICLVGYFFVSLIGVCEKSIGMKIPLPMILFFQNIVCLCLTIPGLLKSDINTLKTPYIGTYTIRIFCGLGCYATLFYVMRFMPISEAFLYQYSASLWIPFITAIWFRTSIPRSIWFGIIVGFMGIAMILDPGASFFGLISIIGILCGIFQGISVVAIRKLSVAEPTMRILFYNFLVGTIVSGFLLINNWKPINIHEFIWLLGVGFNTYLAQKFITISLKYANATTLAPICYLSILFTGIFGWIIWREIPNELTLAGMFLVIAGCLLSVFLSKQKYKTQTNLLAEGL